MRYALLIVSSIYVIACLHIWLDSRTLREDLAAVPSDGRRP
jgi:hypothetical protein